MLPALGRRGRCASLDRGGTGGCVLLDAGVLRFPALGPCGRCASLDRGGAGGGCVIREEKALLADARTFTLCTSSIRAIEFLVSAELSAQGGVRIRTSISCKSSTSTTQSFRRERQAQDPSLSPRASPGNPQLKLRTSAAPWQRKSHLYGGRLGKTASRRYGSSTPLDFYFVQFHSTNQSSRRG